MSETSVKPNHGATVPDVVAVGDEQESQSSWLKKNNIKPEDRIRLVKLSHMRYQHPDLDEIHRFMTGMLQPSTVVITNPAFRSNLSLSRFWNGGRQEIRRRDLVQRLWI